MKNKTLLLIAILLLSAYSCRLSKSALDRELQEQITNEEEQWKALGISHYRMKVTESSAWYQFISDMVVKDSAVISAELTCGQAVFDPDGSHCNSIISNTDANGYTIEALFESLNNSSSRFKDFGNTGDVYWHECLFVTFDETYHFPKQFSFDHPDVMDEQYSIVVSEFEVVE
jgi:hypothetical protein